MTPIDIKLRRKYTAGWRPKSIKNQKSGNGKSARKSTKVNWTKHTGEGKK